MTHDNRESLVGKVAIVTGSARNIGKATAITLARNGASVVINALQDTKAAERVVSEITENGGTAISILCDILDRKAVDRMVDETVSKLGNVDMLVLNASQRGQKPFTQMNYDEWRNVIDISLDGAFFLSQSCVPHMMKNGWGRIVTLGGISWHVGTPGRVHNLVAKSGLVGFTRGLAVELAEQNITVNCVSPGFIDTERTTSAGKRPSIKIHPPIDRLGTTNEIASMVCYLCQPEAGYITGQTLHVNGGLYLGN
tara:strand:- start:207 stop:968 length:762 start_codon:yes stop_codon:yes gene_type:complete